MSKSSTTAHVSSTAILGVLVAAAVLAPACNGEGGGPLGDVAKQCGLECSAKGFAGGDAKISGIASIDAFFGAAIDLDASMRGLSGSLRGELDAIGASVGLAPGATGAEIKTAIDGYLAARVDGGLTVQFKPAKCEASVEASVSAAAECDVDVDPGEVSVKCEGACKVDASASAGCSADAEVRCTGTAPDLACSGTCSGSCVANLDVAASCEGTCRGSCTANGSTMDGFEGKCGGTCMGECAVEMSAGATCTGRCEGSCEYTPPSGMCEANAEVECQAKAGASVDCKGTCEGTAEPPMVSAECEATVDAKAKASIECTPPSIDIGFRFAAALDGDLDAQAEFRAWLEGFRAHFSALLALRAKADIVVDAAAGLGTAAEGAVGGAIDDLKADANIAAAFGAACAVEELPVAVEAIGESSTKLGGEVSAAAEVIAAFGG